MIEFHTPTLSDRGWIDALLATGRARGCEYNFSTLFAWHHAYRQEVAQVGDFFTERIPGPAGCSYLFPVGTGDLSAALDAISADSRQCSPSLRLIGVTGEDVLALDTLYPGRFHCEPNRSVFDYLYEIDRLADLGGKKLHGKRNHIHRFLDGHPDWTFEPITAETIPACIAMDAEWYLQQTNGPFSLDNSLQEERLAIQKCFDHYDALELEGGLLRVSGNVVAFTIGDRLHANSDTYNVHFEKAFSDMQGVYAMINREFARWVRDRYPAVRYLNREEDMGLPGLRKAKESYYPDLLLEKFSALERRSDIP